MSETIIKERVCRVLVEEKDGIVVGLALQYVGSFMDSELTQNGKIVRLPLTQKAARKTWEKIRERS